MTARVAIWITITMATRPARAVATDLRYGTDAIVDLTAVAVVVVARAVAASKISNID
jgi:hypothetical protein